MNARLRLPINGHELPDLPSNIDTRSPEEVFIDLCGARAAAVDEGILSRREAADELQGYAKLSGLIGRIGQDTVQLHLAQAFAAFDICEPEVYDGAADIIRRYELADWRDAWKWTGEAPPPPERGFSENPPSYRTPEQTVQAFWCVVRLDDPDYLARWLAHHPRDAAHLLKIWKAKP